MAATLRNLLSQIRSGRNNPGFYDAHIPSPGRIGPRNMELALSILDGSFFRGDTPKNSPDISNLPLELQNLREGVKIPCCDILDTPEQK